jgi:leader peptidase (prepilin peptidase) / N-methyltransferase
MDLPAPLVGSIAVAISPLVGSLICCAVDRSPNFASSILERSHCESCTRSLRPRDLVPIFSFVALKGRCSHCGSKIPRRLIATEFGILAITATAVLSVDRNQAPFAVAFAWLAFFLAQYDWVHGRLPDALTAALCLTGLGWIVCFHREDFVNFLVGAVFGFLIPLGLALIYRKVTQRDGLGGGDIKLFGASGAWIGWQGFPFLLLLSSLSALIGAVIAGQRSSLDRLVFGPFIAFSAFLIWCCQAALP